MSGDPTRYGKTYNEEYEEEPVRNDQAANYLKAIEGTSFAEEAKDLVNPKALTEMSIGEREQLSNKLVWGATLSGIREEEAQAPIAAIAGRLKSVAFPDGADPASSHQRSMSALLTRQLEAVLNGIHDKAAADPGSLDNVGPGREQVNHLLKGIVDNAGQHITEPEARMRILLDYNTDNEAYSQIRILAHTVNHKSLQFRSGYDPENGHDRDHAAFSLIANAMTSALTSQLCDKLTADPDFANSKWTDSWRQTAAETSQQWSQDITKAMTGLPENAATDFNNVASRNFNHKWQDPTLELVNQMVSHHPNPRHPDWEPGVTHAMNTILEMDRQKAKAELNS